MKPVGYVLLLLWCAGNLSAQEGHTEISAISDYNGWGWDAIVMKNDLITVATVPVIGARIMQYDLGEHRSIFVNEDEFGKTYTPASNSPWYNYGGYKMWPAPQAVWNWPPPPILDFGVYESEIRTDTPDSVQLFVRSQVEKWKARDIRFERTATIYRGSSRVRVAQTMINEGSSSANWSVWDVTQDVVNSPGERDYENFWVYFPINPDSRYGSEGVRTSANSRAWQGEVAPGIYGVQFLPEGKKIFADSHEGWLCYVNELEGYAFAKVFDLYDGADYPDDGARVEVWINNNPLYLEAEVVSPIVELSASGGRYTFVIDWYAAKLNGPVLHVNHVGAITRRMELEDDHTLSGEYGVFHKGTAKLVFIDSENNTVGEGTNHEVSPEATFSLREQVDIPASTHRIDIRLTDMQGGSLGVLESSELAALTQVKSSPRSLPGFFRLLQNFPNPFNAGTVIEFELCGSCDVRIDIYDVNGRMVDTLLGDQLQTGVHRFTWNPGQMASGVYLYRVQAGRHSESRKMILLR